MISFVLLAHTNVVGIQVAYSVRQYKDYNAKWILYSSRSYGNAVQ